MYRVSYPETGDIQLPGKPLSFDVDGALPPSNPADDLEYDALDRFDRLVELNWGQRGYGFAERLAYWYDRVGTRLARRSRPYVPWSLTPDTQPVTRTHDERYQYDALYRLRDMHRGTLPGDRTRNPQSPATAIAPTFHQQWQLDQQDNWERLDEQAFGDEGYQFGQTRTHDRSNRVKTIMSGGPPVSVAFDDAGNMDYIPDATDPGNLDKGLYCEYDAWNRLVHVRRGGRPVADYEYDGLGRRIVKRVYHKDTGVLTEARHFYYSQGWQVLQERVAVDPEGETPWETRLDRQYVWGVRGPDDLILRDRETRQTPIGIPNERQYALADGNGNIISLYDVQHEYSAVPAKRLVERIEYDAYGRARFMDKDFGSLSESGKDWSILYGGYYYDAETGLYHVRNRMYDPLYGRWLQTDPSGFGDSYNLYQYGLSSPLTYVDPEGRFVIIGGILITAAIGAAIGAGTYAATTDEFKTSEFVLYTAGGAAAGALSGLAFFGTAAALSYVGVTATYTAVAAGGVSGYVGGFTNAFVVTTGESRLAGAEWSESLAAGAVAGHQEGAIGAVGGVLGGAVLARFGAGAWSTLASGASGGFAAGAVSGGIHGYAETGSLGGTLSTAAYQAAVGGVLGGGMAMGGRFSGQVARRIRALPAQPPGLDPRSTRSGKLMIGTYPVNENVLQPPRSRIVRALIGAGVLSGRVRRWWKEYDISPLIAHHEKPLALGGADILRNFALAESTVHQPKHPVGISQGIVYY